MERFGITEISDFRLTPRYPPCVFFFDESLQILGEVSRRISDNRRLTHSTDFDLSTAWREFWYQLQTEFDDRTGERYLPTPKYKTAGDIGSVIGVVRKLHPDFTVEIETYSNDNAAKEMGSITAVVSNSDRERCVKYNDSMGISRRFENETFWTLEGLEEHENEKFLLGPIGDEGLLLFHWDSYAG